MTTEALAVPEQPEALAPTSLFGTGDPLAVIGRAREVAVALKDVVDHQGLISEFKDNRGNLRKHPRVEAWTLLGSMLGVFPVTQWTRPITDEAGKIKVDSKGRTLGYEARVEAHTLSGAVVGAAEAMCTRLESSWGFRDDYALRSMAQTRATSKSLRQPLDFVMQLAGYAPTPAEEMVGEEDQNRRHPDAGSGIGDPYGDGGDVHHAPVEDIPRARGKNLRTIKPGPTAQANQQELRELIGQILEQAFQIEFHERDGRGQPVDAAVVSEAAKDRVVVYARNKYGKTVEELDKGQLMLMLATLQNARKLAEA